MKQLLILFIAFSGWSLFAQQPVPSGKGVTPLATPLEGGRASPDLSGGVTRAVVVGISDYQDAAIPDLRFADRDAEAFANFLRSPAGGSLDGDHLKVLLDSQATVAQFAIALDWLMENSKEGDEAIIYFSGHGDVEKKTLTQPGFLLCWDAPARVYMAGGAFNLRDVQEIVSTLSIQNKAKVVVITDACRSGTLAGQSVGGAQATAANLAKQYANEIKILSCQPNEYSIEGEQWGGGRGAFSFNLVDALYGMADGNNDLFVNLREVGRYLEDHVAAEVAPVSQNPKVVGDPNERLASVDAKLLADLRSGRTSQMKMLSAIESRGMEDDVLATVDTTVREMYRLFKKALKDRVFLMPAEACAEAWYERLTAEPKLSRLHSTMRRNYAAALQDDAQQVMNEWMRTGDEQIQAAAAGGGKGRLPQKVFTEKVRSFPRLLERAAELLGQEHYMYAVLQARKYFFEGYLLTNADMNPNQALGEQALTAFRKALDRQAELPQAYWQMSRVYGWNLLQPDSAEAYSRKAIELNPAWVLPYTDLAFMFSVKYKQFDRAKPWLEQAMRLDSNSTAVWNSWGAYFVNKKEFFKAEQQWKKAIQLDSTIAFAYNSLGSVYLNTRRYAEAEPQFKKAIQLDSTYTLAYNNLGVVYLDTRRYAEAEQQLKKAIQLDSTAAAAYNNLGGVYYITRRDAEAEQQYKKAIQLDSTLAAPFTGLGVVYLNTRRYAEAEQQYKKAIQLDSTYADAYYNLACLQSLQNRTDAAFDYLEMALKNGLNDYDWMQQDSDLAPLREQKDRWEALMQSATVPDTTDARAWNNLGQVYIRVRNYAPAEAAMKKAVALNAVSVPFRSNLGFVYLNLGRYAEAEAALTKAIALDSAFANARKHLGMVCFKTKRPEEARQHFLKAIALNPNYAGAMLGMAYVLAAEGKTDEAIGYVEQAIGKGSTFEQLEKDEDLAPLRAHKEQWEALMKKYFSDQIYYNLACEQSLKGELDKAFESLEQSLTSGWKNYDWMQQDTDLAPLREQKERWAVLMKKYFPEKGK